MIDEDRVDSKAIRSESDAKGTHQGSLGDISDIAPFEMALEYYGEILAKVFLTMKNNERRKN